MKAIFDFLESNNISYTRVDHPAVFTCEEADRLVPEISGKKTKNLFLRDGKARRHILRAVSPDKNVDLKALGKLLQMPGLGLASPDRLNRYLGVDPGSVTLLAVLNDESNVVDVFIDEDLWTGAPILCHPLINTSTLAIPKEQLETFFRLTSHSPTPIAIPTRG